MASSCRVCALLSIAVALLVFCSSSSSTRVVAASSPTAGSATEGAYLRWWTSVQEWTSRLEQQPSIILTPTHKIHGAPNILTVDVADRYQTLLGFGGAITESAALTLTKLPEELIARVISAYYGPDGHRYTLARLSINANDFSLGNWNYDDVEGDFELQHFDRDVTHDNDTGLIPFAKRALKASEGRLKFFASPWSPPKWLKSNNNMEGSDKPCLKSGDRYAQTWADYYVQWMRAYEKHGIKMLALTVQNEPEFAAPWEACSYTPEEQRVFVEKFLAPTVSQDYPNVEIWGYDHNKDHVETWADELTSTAAAREAFAGIAVHFYSGDSFDALNNVHEKHPDLNILATEACNCPGVRLNAWDRAEKYAHDIIGDLNNWVTAWVDWNIVLDHRGGPNHKGNLCDAHIIVRDDWKDWPALHFQPSYYIMGHFTRFLAPGSVRVGHKLSNPHGNREIHHIGKDQADAGASSSTPAQSANVASDNTNLEIFTAVSKKRAQDRIDPDDEAEEEVIIVIFNPSDTEEKIQIRTNNDLGTSLTIPAHSIHTVVGPSSFFA